MMSRINALSKLKNHRKLAKQPIEELVEKVKAGELEYSEIKPFVEKYYKTIEKKVTEEDIRKLKKRYKKKTGEKADKNEIKKMAVDYMALNSLFGISINGYINANIYEKSFTDKLIVIKENGKVRSEESLRAIEALAAEENLSKLGVVAKHNERVNELGLSFATYYKNTLYEMTDSMQQIRSRVLLRKKAERATILEQLIERSGKSKKEIKEHIAEINKDSIYRINIERYYFMELYTKTPEEIDEIRKNARKSNDLRRKLRIKLDDVRDGVISFESVKPELDQMYEYCRVFATETKAEELAELYTKDEINNISNKELLERTLDCIVTTKVINFTEKAYVAFKFHEKSFEERFKYLSENDKVRMMTYMATDEALDTLNNKYLTYKALTPYYGREAILIKNEEDLNSFREFCDRHDIFVKKALTDSLGNSIELIDTKEEDVESIFKRLIEENNEVLLEECIVAHPSIGQFNPDSVNTVRLTTYNDNGNVLFPCTTMRFGMKGSFVDNAGAGGVSVLIDSKTGVIISDGFAQDGSIYECHPDSGVKFKGFQLPLWEDALALGREIAKEIKGTVYIGWDIALNADGKWVIIEGNAKPQLYGVQSTGGEGAWYQFYDIYLKHKFSDAHEKVYIMPYSHIQKNGRAESLQLLADETGISYEEVYYKAERASVYYDIPWFTYVQRKLILEDENELKRLSERRNKRIEIQINEIAEELDITYDEAASKAEDANMRYGLSLNDYFMSKLFLLSSSELAKVVGEKEEYANNLQDKLVDISGKSLAEIKMDMKHRRIKYGLKQNTYTTLQCYKHSDEVLDTYLMTIEQDILMDKYNDPEYTKYFRSKELFHEAFHEYMGRDSWVNKDTSFEEFSRFIEGKKVLFGKPDNSYGGKGTSVVPVEGDLGELYENLISEPLTIYEEYIVQHHLMSEVYSGSLNTVRVVTINDGNDVNVILSFVRFGNGGIVDNMSSGGMCAAVDINTGRIMTKAIDMHDTQYERHPVSNIRFTDITIPHWDKVIQMVKEAGTKIPEVGFVGWDVAICEDKVLLVEGNDKATLSGYQVCFADKQEGKRYLVEKYL